MKCLVIDTETAGLDGGVCDIAIAHIDNGFNVLWSVDSLIDPERPIKASASGIHGIVDADVFASPTLAEFMELQGYPLSGDLVLGGHNVSFDCRMLDGHLPLTYRKLDTLRLARNLWPENDDHKLQTLRYQFGLDAGQAHRAMGDVLTCVSLMRLIAQQHDVDLDGLIELALKPLTLDSRISFGKHKGTKLGDLDNGYVNWLLNKADSLDPDLREALALR